MEVDVNAFRWVLTINTDGTVKVESNWLQHPTNAPFTQNFPNGITAGAYIRKYRSDGDEIRIQNPEGHGLEFTVLNGTLSEVTE